MLIKDDKLRNSLLEKEEFFEGSRFKICEWRIVANTLQEDCLAAKRIDSTSLGSHIILWSEENLLKLGAFRVN